MLQKASVSGINMCKQPPETRLSPYESRALEQLPPLFLGLDPLAMQRVA